MNERLAADAYCKLLTASHYENFIVAGPLVRSELRVHLRRIYAFCRTTDDLGDESGGDALSRLARWRDEVVGTFEGHAPVHPVLIALRETIAECALPAAPFLDLIQANVMDQSVHSYETWPDLLGYCMLSAAPVGRLVLRVFNIYSSTAEKLSDDVCNGLQLANHAQDVTRDRAIGRTYLLQSDIRSHGIAGAVRALCDRATALLQSGRALEAMAPYALRLQLALYRLGGLAICRRIAALDYRTDLRRPSIGAARRWAIFMLAALQSLHRLKEPGSAQALGSHR
ncbi:MAG: squalene/phytoene synthase family protein [Candidatus Eremiobacteraeota bacterium]|nr:squalene/phytoene synthase family protein [Candidatus Eremiobacteraeota bacterium]